MLKRFRNIIFCVIAFSACSKEVDEVYTLSVDKDVIEADGKDMAVFTITDASGNVMTTDSNMGKIYFKNVATGFNLQRRSIGFTCIENGIYEFVGVCKGVQTANTVKITVRNRKNYEVYHRNVGLFKCTSVWCSACPELSSRLHGLDVQSARHSVVLSCHGKFSGKADPFAVVTGSTDLGNQMLLNFRGSGWPTLVYDLDVAETGAGVSHAELAENIMNRRIEFPATCGIKVNKSEITSGTVTVNASIRTSASGNYDLTCALMEDGLSYDESGSFSVGGNGIFDDVLLAVQPNFMSYSSATGKSLAAGEEFTTDFKFETGVATFPSDRLEKISVVVFAHRRTSSDKSVMDNIVSVPFGQKSEYILND